MELSSVLRLLVWSLFFFFFPVKKDKVIHKDGSELPFRAIKDVMEPL